MSSRWSHASLADIASHDVLARAGRLESRVRELCVERWSLFALLSCGVLAALGAGSAFGAENWAATAFFAVLTATLSIVGVRNFFAVKK